MEVSAASQRRFWAKVDRRGPEDCWLWTASLFAYELLVGEIPQGLVLDHLCQEKLCVNPAHMEPVTNIENSRRGARGPEVPVACPRGHPYSEENTYYCVAPGAPADKAPRRFCRTCQRSNARRHRERSKRP